MIGRGIGIGVRGAGAGVDGLLRKYDSPFAANDESYENGGVPLNGNVRDGGGFWEAQLTDLTWVSTIDMVRDKSGSGNDLAATVPWKVGVDNRGRPCIKGTGTEYGEVDFVTEYSQPYVVGWVGKLDSLVAVAPYFFDGQSDGTDRVLAGFDSVGNKLFASAPTTNQSTVPADVNWAYYTLLVKPGSTGELWRNGTKVLGPVDMGASKMQGFTVMRRYSGTTNFLEGQMSNLQPLVNLTDPDQAVKDMNRYLKIKNGL